MYNELITLIGQTDDAILLGHLGRAVRRLALLDTQCSGVPTPDEFTPVNIVGYHSASVVANDNPNPNYLTFEEVELALNGQKINAIKLYRNRTGMHLLESKRAIESDVTPL